MYLHYFLDLLAGTVMLVSFFAWFRRRQQVHALKAQITLFTAFKEVIQGPELDLTPDGQKGL